MFKQIAPVLAVFALASACATTAPDEPKGVAKFAEDPRLGEKVDRICFNRSIDSFHSNDRDTVVVREGVNDHYLIEVRGICPNLRRAQTIGIDAFSSCVSRNDALIVSSSPFSLNDETSIGPDRCLIRSIYKWDEDAENEEAGEAEET